MRIGWLNEVKDAHPSNLSQNSQSRRCIMYKHSMRAFLNPILFFAEINVEREEIYNEVPNNGVISRKER